MTTAQIILDRRSVAAYAAHETRRRNARQAELLAVESAA